MAPFYGYGIGYSPAVVFPPEIGYPSGTAYPSDSIYTPPDPSATLQYTPLPNQYSSLESLPGEDVTASNAYGVPLREETLLYLKDGSVFAVAGYSVSNGRLRYRTAYGEKNELGVDELDIQKTIEANAERGVAFTLTPPPAPNSTPGASKPTPLGPAPAPEGPITAPKF